MQRRRPNRVTAAQPGPELPFGGSGMGGGEPDAVTDLADSRPIVDAPRQAFVSGAELDRIVADIYRAYEPMKRKTGCRMPK